MTRLPDQDARDRIERDLDTNLLVEAGAGSGKTTALVGRMVSLVRRGTQVERIAAVTFTRKAAAELRERFREALEEELRDTPTEDPTHEALLGGLARIDRVFMGTIHAFCARLLRERPLEAGLDPAFSELTAARERVLALEWWEEWLERISGEGELQLSALADHGIRASDLFHTFTVLNQSLDIPFPAAGGHPPDAEVFERTRADLSEFLSRAETIFPDEEPEAGWGPAQEAMRSAWFVRRTTDWTDPSVFFPMLQRIRTGLGGLTLNRFPPEERDAARRLRDDLKEWLARGGPARDALEQWHVFRYPLAIDFARRAARDFAAFRWRTGRLTFHDLLYLTARLLRSHPEVRSDLGSRYPHLLVDEFQDTDPLQAEILFLLAADPTGEPQWLSAVPRPGSLFAVGDPKQSIYRFRRADIAMYKEVRDRFDPALGGFGDVLRLTANFRSGEGVADLVNAVFDREDHFPREGTSGQAPFAPLQPYRTPAPGSEGVRNLDLPPCRDAEDARRTGARAVARWIARRIEAGERKPDDFLVLTRTKKELGRLAAAIEGWGIPVDVAGAKSEVSEELAQLRTLLSALADPGNPVYTVAAVTGLFFGVDLEELLAWKERGGSFDFREVGEDGSPGTGVKSGEGGAGIGAMDAPGAVAGRALATLRRWWLRSLVVPSDIAVAEMVAESGLLPYVVGGDLGSVKGGTLVFALDLIRAACLAGDGSLAGAVEAIEAGLEEEEWEAPLEPGRGNTVRVMNLHKAKGLEAPVVILADPSPTREHPPRVAVSRSGSGQPEGWMEIGVPGTHPGTFTVLGHPPGWADVQAAEKELERAEEVRLLYVAATRAGDELLVLRDRSGRDSRSVWSPLHEWLDAHAGAIEGEDVEPPPRAVVEEDADAITRRGLHARERLLELGKAGYRFAPVTTLAKGGDGAVGLRSGATESLLTPAVERPPTGPAEADPHPAPVFLVDEGDSAGPGGVDWGSAVHVTLDAARRGLEGDALRSLARAALLERDRPVRDGEPTELELLLSVVGEVATSELWKRAEAADVLLTEHPFTVETGAGIYLEGVIDLLFREEEGWVVVDYKTDRHEAGYNERLPEYREQVRMYAEAWAKLSGEPVKERIVYRVGRSSPSPEG